LFFGLLIQFSDSITDYYKYNYIFSYLVLNNI